MEECIDDLGGADGAAKAEAVQPYPGDARQMSKDAQTKAKDIGGYIGGVLKEEGSRRDDNLLLQNAFDP